MNSDELFEIAYCKGKRESMKSIVMWLKEHAAVARNALKGGMDAGNVLSILLDSMERAFGIMDAELSKRVVLLSLQEKPSIQEKLAKELAAASKKTAPRKKK